MKAMDELVEGEEELMFRGKKATGISSFLHLSVVGVRPHLPVPPNSAACVCSIVLFVLSACFPACDGGIPWCGRLVGCLINAPEPRRCVCVSEGECVYLHFQLYVLCVIVRAQTFEGCMCLCVCVTPHTLNPPGA